MYNKYGKHAFDPISRILTVVGIGMIEITSNLATINFEVKTEAKQMLEAQQENSYQMKQIIQSLIQFGIPRDNIQTRSFEVRPVYDYIDGKQEFRGYEVINMISVTMDNVDLVGNVIDLALQNGATNVFNLQFSHRDSQVYERQALAKALEDANSKAHTLVQQMHVNIDPIPIKIVEEFNEQPIPFLKNTLAESNVLPSIEPGVIQMQAKVRVNFRYA